MMRFRFRFSTLEKVRRSREESALRAFGEAQNKLRNAMNEKLALEGQLNESLLRRELLAQGSVSVVAYQTENDFIIGLKQRIIQAGNFITRCQRGVEKALRAYLLARRQTRAIEILREKDHQEFKLKLKKREEKELNDLYTMRSQLESLTQLKESEVHSELDGGLVK